MSRPEIKVSAKKETDQKKRNNQNKIIPDGCHCHVSKYKPIVGFRMLIGTGGAALSAVVLLWLRFLSFCQSDIVVFVSAFVFYRMASSS